jgi:hypothetical protein
MERKSAQEMVDQITDFVNVYGFDKDGFKDAFRRQHRTLQQSTIRLFLEVIEMVGKEDYQTDLRNEDAKEVCAQLVKGWRMAKEKETGREHDSFFPSQFLGHI